MLLCILGFTLIKGINVVRGMGMGRDGVVRVGQIVEVNE